MRRVNGGTGTLAFAFAVLGTTLFHHLRFKTPSRAKMATLSAGLTSVDAGLIGFMKIDQATKEVTCAYLVK